MKKVTALAFLNQVLMPYFVCPIYICIISNTTTVKAHMLENKISLNQWDITDFSYIEMLNSLFSIFSTNAGLPAL